MTTHDAEQVVGYINPDGTGAGNWMTPRITDACPSCGQPNHRIRYQAERNPEGSQLVEIIAGTLVFLLLIGALFWALPVLFAVAS